jgi:hypothetical protein
VKKIIFLSALILPVCSFGQGAAAFKDEKALYAETKQVNQFFRRFNNEESIEGNRYYSNDSLYRNPASRIRFLGILFDNQNPGLGKELKEEFIKHVTDPRNPVYLDLHGGGWFAQVNTLFTWKGKETPIILYLKLQEEKVGSKWVIFKARFSPFLDLFNKDTTANRYFLHPLSHELDFMNLYKVFQDNREHIEDYTPRDFPTDPLVPLLYEVKKGNLKFHTVTNVKFHFFQVNNWYFELSKFNRSGFNTGWLISALVRLESPEEKNTLLQYIYDKIE